MEDGGDVGFGYRGQSAQGPVFADLGEPADTAGFGRIGIGFADELVEGRSLGRGVGVVVVQGAGAGAGAGVFDLVIIIFFPDSLAYGAETLYGFAKLRGKRCGDFSSNAGGQFTAIARRGDADLERPVGVGGEEGEGTKVWGIGHVYWDSESFTQGRYVSACIFLRYEH